MLKHLLFDVMGTLVYDPFYREVPEFFGLTFEDLLAEKHPTAWAEFETGEIGEGEFFRRFFKDGREFDHPGLRSVMEQNYRWIDGMRELLEELNKGECAVHLFSNYPVWYQLVDGRVGLSQYAEEFFISCELGHRKPTTAAFQKVLGKLRAGPDECLLVDDMEENCAAAKKLGMDVVTFEGVSSLRHSLEDRGLLARLPDG